jgi:hypothetical protein
MMKEHTSSKKTPEQRRTELIKAIIKPLETFFEENFQYYLFEINKNLVLRQILSAIVECKQVLNNQK